MLRILLPPGEKAINLLIYIQLSLKEERQNSLR